MTTSNTNNTKIQFTFDELNDLQRQKLAEAYTRKHLFTRQNEMVEFILDSDQQEGVPFGHDDITNNECSYYIPHLGEYLTKNQIENKLEKYSSEYDFTLSLTAVHKAAGCSTVESEAQKEKFAQNIVELENYENSDMNYPEFYEYYIVDRFTCESLDEVGDSVITDHNIWCRQTTGQCVTIDHCIQKVAFNHFSEYETDYITIETLNGVCK